MFRQLAELYSRDVDVDRATAEYNQLYWLVKTTPEIKAELGNANVQDFLLFLKRNKLDVAYPNVSVMYRILGTISVSTAGAERSFSKLKLIKNYLRSTMSEERLSGLALISIEREFAESANMDSIINRFAGMKKRKLAF